MIDTFVPLVTANKPRENGFAAFNVKAIPSPANKGNEGDFVAKTDAPAHSPESCAKPTITLQRTGDVVTSIRVQCGCGQVIELACVY